MLEKKKNIYIHEKTINHPTFTPTFHLLQIDAAEDREGGGVPHTHTARESVPLDACIAGLDSVLGAMMGVRLQEAALVAGEGWAPGVRKVGGCEGERGGGGGGYTHAYV